MTKTIVYGLPALAKALGLSLSTVKRLHRNKEIPSGELTPIGRKFIVEDVAEVVIKLQENEEMTKFYAKDAVKNALGILVKPSKLQRGDVTNE